MTTEQLTKGNEIRNNIAELKKKRDYYSKVCEISFHAPYVNSIEFYPKDTKDESTEHMFWFNCLQDMIRMINQQIEIAEKNFADL